MHGWGGDLRAILPLAERFRHSYRCICIDFAGFGETPAPSTPYSVDDYAADIKQIIDYYMLSDVILVGHSFGGRVAIKLGAYCTAISHVVLLDSAGVRPRRGLKYMAKVLRYKLCRMCGFDTSSMGSDDYRELSQMMKITFKQVINEDLTPHLKHMHIPVLIVFGERDKDTPIYMARKLNRGIPNSHLVIVEGAGHFAYLDKLAEVTAHIADFLYSN